MARRETSVSRLFYLRSSISIWVVDDSTQIRYSAHFPDMKRALFLGLLCCQGGQARRERRFLHWLGRWDDIRNFEEFSGGRKDAQGSAEQKAA
jgi:hypothetical protein